MASYEESQRHFTINIQQAGNQPNDTRDNEPLNQQDEIVNLQLQVIDESDHADHGKKNIFFNNYKLQLFLANYNVNYIILSIRTTLRRELGFIYF